MKTERRIPTQYRLPHQDSAFYVGEFRRAALTLDEEFSTCHRGKSPEYNAGSPGKQRFGDKTFNGIV